jgi:hypothetical protein
MYYNRILRLWVLDPLDYFLISALIGSLVASHLKTYLSEKAAMERLKKSIINKSKLASKTNRPILKSKDSKIKRIYRFALYNRGGQFEEFQADHEFSNEVFKMAQQIEQMVARLAAFLKQRELKGIAKIFFKNGRLILELLLYKCNINITYSVLTGGLSTQVIVLTATAGGAAGFTLSWFTAGATLVAPPLLISALLLRSVTQQFLNQREYSNFKKMVDKMLDDDDLKETLQAFFMEGEGPTARLEMKPSDLDQNPALKHDFSVKSSEEFEEFIKARMKEEFGLIENPTETQLEEIIHRKVKRKPKGKTVYFRDFIDEISDYDADISDSDISDIIDAEIIEESIKVRSDNEL